MCSENECTFVWFYAPGTILHLFTSAAKVQNKYIVRLDISFRASVRNYMEMATFNCVKYLNNS